MADRTNIQKLPGKVVIDQAGANVNLYSSEPIITELREENIVLSTNRDGSYDEVTVGRMVQVKIKPTQFTAAALTALFKHGAVAKGGSIIGATDKTLDVHTIDGVRRRIANAFVYGEPAITCQTGKTILGEVTFYGIIPLAGDPAVLAQFYNKTSVAWDDTSWDPDNELTPGWDFSWSGEAPSVWDDIDTTGGVTITPKSGLDDEKSDRDGLKDVTINDYNVDIKASCLNISEDLVLAAMGWGLPLGAKKGSLGRDLKLNAVGGGAYIRCYNAVLQQPYNFGFDSKRRVVADLSWATRPRYTSGTLGPHLLVTTEDPDEEEV